MVSQADVGARVLVVDDDDVIRTEVGRALERAGHEVVVARDGVEALDRLRALPCDLVLSDVQMPRLDGFALVERLRAAETTRTLPVLLMTALGRPQDAMHGLRVGADDYVRKPFDLDELVARVRVKLERPPVPVADLTAARRVGVLTAERIARETDRELSRATRSAKPLAIGMLTFAEHTKVVDTFGRQAGPDLLALAARVAQTAASPLDLVGLAPPRRGRPGGLLLLMPETWPEDAERRLARIGVVLGARQFTVAGETVHITPAIGWTSSADRPCAEDGDAMVDRAHLAATASGVHLDLLPVRWHRGLARESTLATPSPLARLRTPAQIALTLVLGVGAPFLLYRGLFAAGVDVSGVMYVVVVTALLVTAVLIWWEGWYALRPERPPDRPASPYPKATALIAAYLPNEAATLVETVEKFLAIDYPAELQVLLAYNTPQPMPIEEVLVDIARRDPRFVPFRVDASTSKAENVNAALALVTGEFTGVFDADHHPEPSSFERAWRWLSGGYDVVQGHCLIRNGGVSRVARTIAVEFEAIYAVSHPGRARLHGFGIFGGSNGFWRTTLLREVRMQGRMLTEDIDSSMRVLLRGRRIACDPGLISRELAPTTVRALWNQRIRWAQGWFQVSRRHLVDGWRSPRFSLRNKLGLSFLLGWREIYPWLSLQMWPLIAFLAWRAGGVSNLDWVVPVFVLTTLFTASVGPGQTLFAYRLAAPELRAHRGWFLGYLVVSSLFYTEFKNVVARVAQLKELTGERRWIVTSRS